MDIYVPYKANSGTIHNYTNIESIPLWVAQHYKLCECEGGKTVEEWSSLAYMLAFSSPARMYTHCIHIPLWGNPNIKGGNYGR